MRETPEMLVVAKSEYLREHKVGKRGFFDTKLAAQTELVKRMTDEVNYHTAELADIKPVLKAATLELQSMVAE